MNFDKEDFIKSYQKYLIDLVQESLRDDIYKYVSSTYLMLTISGKQFDFIKKYFRKNNNFDTYEKDTELQKLISDFRSFSLSIILNYYHNKLDFGSNSILNSNYFNDISTSLDFETRNEIGRYLKTYKTLDQLLLNSCNAILSTHSLKNEDIYSLCDETLKKLESQNNFSWDRNDFFSVVTNKINNIFADTLRLFEEENKDHTQLFDYIPLSNNDELIKYKIFCEVNFKKQLLPLILSLKITEALALFKNLSKTYQIENVLLEENSNLKILIEACEKQVINILEKKHIKINFNPDGFDV